MADLLRFGEWRPDASDLRSNWTQRLRNVVPRSDGYGPFHDVTVFTQALPAACRGYFVAFAEDGTVRIFAGTSTKLYLLDNTTLSWTDVSAASGTYSTLNDDANWVFAQFNNIVVATQRNDDMQSFNIESSTEFADLGSDVNRPKAGWVARVGSFLLAGDLADDPFRVQWSGLNEITNWTSGTNSSDFQDFPDGGRPRMGVEVEGGVAVVMQETAARRMVFSPGSEAIFDIERLQNVPGILAPYSAVVTSGGVAYLSTRGFVIVGADGALTPIGEERVNRTFLGQLPTVAPAELRALAYDTSAARLIVGASDPRQSLVMWVYKSTGGADATFDRGLIYHTVLKRWAPIETSGQYIATVSRPGLTLEGLDAIAPGAQTISGCANNGSGLIRVTVGSTSGWTTGDYKTISAVTGTTEANGTWPITVVDGTHIDLQGSTFANAYVSGGVVGGSIDALTFSLDSVSTASLPNISIVDNERKLGFFDGDTLEAELLSAEQSLGARRMNISGIRPITDASSVFGSVVARGNLNEVAVEGTASEMDSDGYCPLLDEGRYARAALRIPAGTDWSFVTGVEPDAAPAGGF
jgi:hypothetical protein